MKEILDNHWFQLVQLTMECELVQLSWHEENTASWWALKVNDKLWAGSNAGNVVQDAWTWLFKEGPDNSVKPYVR